MRNQQLDLQPATSDELKSYQQQKLQLQDVSPEDLRQKRIQEVQQMMGPDEFQRAMAAGLAQAGRGLYGLVQPALAKIPEVGQYIKPMPDITGKLLSPAEQQDITAKIGQFAGQAIPYAIGGPEEAAIKGITGLGRASEALGALKPTGLLGKAAVSAGKAATTAIPSALTYGTLGAAFAPQDREKEGVIGALMGPIGDLASKAVGSIIHGASNISPAIKNSLLKHLAKSETAIGGARTPEEAADLMKKQYTTPTGEELPVDIGTLSGDPILSNLYGATGVFPWSGTKQAMRSVEKGQQLIQAKPLQDRLEQAENLPDYESLIRSTVSEMGAPSGQSDREAISNQIFNKHKENTDIGHAKYDQFQDSQLRLDQMPQGEFLPNYTSSAKDLDVTSQNLKDVFGSDKDLLNSVRSELGMSKNIANKGRDLPLTLSEALTRSRKLGDLQWSATKAGQGGGAQILGDLKDNLDNDLESLLRNNNQNSVADQISDAKQWWRTQVRPYRDDNVISRLSYGKKIPDANAISKSILHPDNIKVYDDLPAQSKNNLLSMYITQGANKDSLGNLQMSAPEVIKRYNKLPQEGIRTISQNHPIFDQMMRDGISAIQRKEEIPGLKDDITKILEQPKAKAQIPTSAKVGAGGTIGALASIFAPHLAGAAALAGTAAIPIAHQLAKILRDPELRNAFLSGSKVPTKTTKLDVSKLPTAVKAALMGAQTQGDQ